MGAACSTGSQREIHRRDCQEYRFALARLLAVPTLGMVDKLRVVHPTRRVFQRRVDDAFFIHRWARLSGLLAGSDGVRASVHKFFSGGYQDIRSSSNKFSITKGVKVLR